MTYEEVILSDPYVKGEGKYLVLDFQNLVRKGICTILQKDGTVCTVTKRSDDVTELHFFSVESPLAVRSAMREFYKQMTDMGVTHVYGMAEIDSPSVKFLIGLGYKIEESDHPHYKWMGTL